MRSSAPHFERALPLPQAGRHTWSPAALPAGLAFLRAFGVSDSLLNAAADAARRDGTAPEAALLASGAVRESFYYRSLACWLGTEFWNGEPELSTPVRYPSAIHAGLALLEAGREPCWLAAPQGEALARLIKRASAGEHFAGRLAITTPSSLAKAVGLQARASIAREATLALANLDPSLSAKTPLSPGQRKLAVAAAGAAAFAGGLAPQPALTLATMALACLFLASIWLRLLAGAASTALKPARIGPKLKDRDLPIYSIIIALHREGPVVPQLIRALDAIDYPRTKLDIKLVIEEDDHATRRVIEALSLPPRYEIVIAPAGSPKTKPRALNVALPLARGEFLAVFDAEDTPDPAQLRQAAGRFLGAPKRLACLQARLAIDNIDDSWLTRLFAIEYAALFDVLNPGLAGLGIPLPLGGSSNHFRTEVLRDLCGWDAWNVTEDADLGFRLARFGFKVGILPSSTIEEAPARLGAWLKQRRRWSKGWMQTFLTLSRDPKRLIGELGLPGSLALALMLTSLVIAPPLWPFLTALAAYDLTAGLPPPASPVGILAASIWTSALVFGAASILWLSLLGMERRKLLSLWPILPLLPLYYLLTSVAAWLAIYDLILRPYHWHKTEHGLARTSRQGLLRAQTTAPETSALCAMPER